MTTQLDRIENMLIAICEHTPGINLDLGGQTPGEIMDSVRVYTKDLVEDGSKL